MPISVHTTKNNDSQETHLYENATQFRFNSQSRTFEIQTKNRKIIAVYSSYAMDYLTLEDPKVISSEPPKKPTKLD